MGTLVQSEPDIDGFIRKQKDQLQQERHQLNQYTEQSRYPAGQQVVSPSSRKQWDRGQAKGTRPAEEKRAPAEPEETGLPFSYGVQEKKRQQLQSERHQEYNDMLAQRGQKLRRLPGTPSQEGLPLGVYEKKRKVYDTERQKEMQQAMEAKRAGKQQKANVFDYHEAEKAHMSEKRKEYNEYLDKKRQQKRHIVTPEEGMFIGTDQSQRNNEIRERSRKNQQALEEQQREQLLFKARQLGQIPKHSPRKGPFPGNKQQPAVPYKPPPPPTPPPAAGQRSNQGQGYEIEERVMDMPKVSPRRTKPSHPEPRVAFMPEQEQSPRRLPIYMEESSDTYKGHERPKGQGQPHYDRGERMDRAHDRHRDERDYEYDRHEGPQRSQGHPDFDRGRRDDRRHYHPLTEVRRSRSFSPPAERRHRDKSPEEVLEEQRRMIENLKQTPPTRQRATWDSGAGEVPGQSALPPGDLYRLTQQQKVQRMYEEQMAERQQLLHDEYRREVAEEQRLATEKQGFPIGASDRQKLGDERNKEYNEYLAKNNPQRSFRVKEPTPEHLRQGLPLDQGKYNEKKHQLELERHREYNELIQKQQQQENLKHQQQQQQQYQNQQQQQQHQNQQQQQYQNKQQRQQQQQQQYQNQQRQQQHYQNQQQQYREPSGQPSSSPAQSQLYETYEKGPRGGSRRVDVLEGTGATLPIGGEEDTKRQQLNSERAREYNEQQKQKLAHQRQRGLPPKPPTPNHFFKNIGQHDRQQEMLQEERKKEYNQKLAEERGRTAGRGNTGAEQFATGLQLKNPDSADVRIGKDVYATLPGLHYSDSADARKTRTRNDEYNEFLREKQWKDAHRFDNKKPVTAASRRHSEPSSPRGKKEYATLPGLHYTDSADKRKMQERNKEYNDFLRQKGGGRKGWATPTYEDILEQKRQEEALRRQDDDYEPEGMRRYASDGSINRLQNDFRERELDKEFESRKVRFDDEFNTQRGGILEDDNWLNPEERREQEYTQLVEPPPRLDDDMAARVRQQPAFLASLPVGGAPGLGAGQDERDSAKRRRQGHYRKELQLQMEESKAAKKREKVQEMRVAATGFVDPEKSSRRMKGLEGQPHMSPRREYKSNEVQPYHLKFLLDDSGDYDALGRQPGEYVRTAPVNVGLQGRGQGLGFGDLGGLGFGSEDHDVLGQGPANPRTAPTLKGILSNGDLGGFQSGDDLQLGLGGGGGGGMRGRRRERDPGLLDPGLAGLIDSRRPIGTSAPPAAIQYVPSTYVTGGGGPGNPYSSIDEAYHYLGMKNPLDVDTGGGGTGIPSLNLGGDYGGGGMQMRGSPTPRVTFADDPPSTRRRDRSKERISPYQFPSDDDVRSRSRSETQNYGAELERQIQEKRMQKMREKQEQARYEQKLEAEIANYNPYGRGGGGAPIKDSQGHAVADLRVLRKGEYESPRRQVSPVYSPTAPAPRDDLIRTPPIQQTGTGESSYARGGHGIFGQPKTEAEKDSSEKYKDDLRDQIAEKRRREQMEKEKERMEEERENKRLEDQRIRMQGEYDEEQKKIRAREEETRRKNEEMKRQVEDKKKEADRKRREADDSRMKEQQEQMDREKREREQREAAANERLKSPPVPALKVKTNEDRGRSPPVPAHRRGRDSAASIKSHTSQKSQKSQRPSPVPGPSSNRPDSSDVLKQLASMRKQLQNERQRVENALESNRNEPDVFDPRLVQRPPANKLIFENAVNKNASLPPPRAQTSDLANARNVEQFNKLKLTDNTVSRQAFRSMFPDAPVTNKTLEDQQDAMLRQQEEQLRNLRDRNPYDPTPSAMSYGQGRSNVSARSQLASNSAFIDVEGIHNFTEDFEDMAGARNDSARARRRQRYSPRNDMGSQASLDVDRIQRKNEERLRRLNNMNTGDDVSMGDPEDILNRFMAKQRHNRPPSGTSRLTLQDDSWLQPGNKVV